MTTNRSFDMLAQEYGLSVSQKALPPERRLVHLPTESVFRFETFYHPYVRELIRQLNIDHLDGLLQWPMTPDGNKPKVLDTGFDFGGYVPNDNTVDESYPNETLDFSDEGETAYSQYNWELFFHVPFLIAQRLSQNQRFGEAQKWFHFIFNPTDRSPFPAPARYWRMRAFYDLTQRTQTDKPPTLQQLQDSAAELGRQIHQWQEHPFSPHLLARLRPIAYQKAVVMKYLDNLIAWGDSLFRRDTIESINEATQLYVLAAKILGKRPESIAPPAEVSDSLTFNRYLALKALDEQSGTGMTGEPASATEDGDGVLDDWKIRIENLLPPEANPSIPDETSAQIVTTAQERSRYFPIPANERLRAYWDTVEDRLFKIRHSLNLAGVARSLPLFDPPIDPALLVKAAAAGVDIASAISGATAAELPHYRFPVMLQKAIELCNEVKSLGGALLSALEKRDAEALSVLRSGHELKLLAAVRQVKEKQTKEADASVAALEGAQQTVEERIAYYRELLGSDNDDGKQALLNTAEAIQLMTMAFGLDATAAQFAYSYSSATLFAIPDFKVSSPSSAGSTTGGSSAGSVLSSLAGAAGAVAQGFATAGSMSGLIAGYQRRSREWAHQLELAKRELEQLKKQSLAAEIKAQIAAKELENHEKQTEQSQEIADFLHDKFTSAELYDWMVGQLSALYFQSYQLAYDLAKRAEKTYRHEIGNDKASFVGFGNWDSLRKGLLAGERLQFDLRRMELAYIEENKRELEITKHISLAELDPTALVHLRETGSCFLGLPEALFDADFPGHYMRRIKSVALTIPCVTGPYQSINCSLTLSSSQIRKDTTKDGQLQDIQATAMVVTSGGQNDSGLFETALRDERYLPFEGAGAISDWRIDLPKDTNSFERDTLSDVILHLRYTARDGGEEFYKQRCKAMGMEALGKPTNATKPRMGRLFSAAHEFPNSWNAFLYGPTEPQTLALDLSPDFFPKPPPGKKVSITELQVLVRVTPEVAQDKALLELTVATGPVGQAGEPRPPSISLKLTSTKEVLDGLPTDRGAIAGEPKPGWTLSVNKIPQSLATADGRLDPAKVLDLGLIFFFEFAKA